MSSPLVEGAKRLERGFEDWVNKIPTPGKKTAPTKQDTSWDGWKEANKSFQTKTESSPKVSTRKPVKRKSAPYKGAM